MHRLRSYLSLAMGLALLFGRQEIMTPEEEAMFWAEYRVRRMHRMRGERQRRGQALMNALAMCAPILARMIHSTNADPFYDDDRIPAFFAELGI